MFSNSVFPLCSLLPPADEVEDMNVVLSDYLMLYFPTWYVFLITYQIMLVTIKYSSAK